MVNTTNEAVAFRHLCGLFHEDISFCKNAELKCNEHKKEIPMDLYLLCKHINKKDTQTTPSNSLTTTQNRKHKIRNDKDNKLPIIRTQKSKS